MTNNQDTNEERQRELKLELESKLERLKRRGINRSTVSKDLGYRENYISSVLSPTGKISKLFVEQFDPYYNHKIASGDSGPGDDVDPPYLQRFEHPFMECDYVYRMRGDSMEPKIPNGSEVGVKRISADGVIINNEIYLVATRDRLASLRCVNAMPDQPEILELSTYSKVAQPTRIRKADIEAIFKAEFVLRFL